MVHKTANSNGFKSRSDYHQVIRGLADEVLGELEAYVENNPKATAHDIHAQMDSKIKAVADHEAGYNLKSAAEVLHYSNNSDAFLDVERDLGQFGTMEDLVLRGAYWAMYNDLHDALVEMSPDLATAQ
jgi:hypothetical protein